MPCIAGISNDKGRLQIENYKETTCSQYFSIQFGHYVGNVCRNDDFKGVHSTSQTPGILHVYTSELRKWNWAKFIYLLA